ncbi:unnamed protein product [Parajaminaea phylloscopi]
MHLPRFTSSSFWFFALQTCHPLRHCPPTLSILNMAGASVLPQIWRSTAFASVRRSALTASSRAAFTTSSSSCSATPAAAAEQSSSDTNKAAAQMKRFWKSVALHTDPKSSHHEVQLDGRPLRTPEGSPLRIPADSRLAASLVAHEWNEQNKIIKSHALPMTSLVARSIDGFVTPEQRAELIEGVLKYAHTDTLCFQESEPKALVRLQGQHWDPLLDWIHERFGQRPKVALDTFDATQSEALIGELRAFLQSQSPLRLAALEKSVHLTKSLYLSLALLEGRVSVEEAMEAAWVETKAQIEAWGEVEDSHDVGWAELGRELGAVRMASLSSGDLHASAPEAKL